ncbi:DUF502 domain-containing protein [Adhaeribacter pallidiroseus]|uniref:DUF502 domain-containing protein n=1 Tax=Adhaeribacter pallidiroseus TaxID=2072847 RepID=A0A369QLF9_9BACT|nr:DUF502 domain-containing protein [Adhaeribacter pallidiroseus]RDC64066.1 hypothetical protein AHMF7616_02676 [Adhaeribacter pallidiroseus]
MKRLLRYFLNGFLILAPISITIYIILAFVTWLDHFFDLGIPGLGIAVMLVLVTLVGFISSSFLVRPFLVISERLLTRVPLVSIIYSSIKDLFNAFVGDNQKFNKPVLVKMNSLPETFRMGFVTHDNLTSINQEDKVAVYFPDSYNFSGELWFVHRDNLTYLELPSSEVMKFIVSGGVAKL